MLILDEKDFEIKKKIFFDMKKVTAKWKHEPLTRNIQQLWCSMHQTI